MLLLPQLATDVSETDAAQLIVSPNWAVQEKADGERMFVGRGADNQVILTNRRGEATSLPAGLEAPAMPPRSLVDVEYLHTRQFCCLDLLAWDGTDIARFPMRNRWKALEVVVSTLGPTAFLVPCAFDLEGKARLVKQLRDEFAEGLILKDINAAYTSGRPSSGGTLRRVKWRKRLDAVLFRKAGDEHAAFEVFLWSAAGPVNVGRVSAHTYWDRLDPNAYQVAELSYLYATGSQKLFQPSIVRFRNDKTPQECRMDQLVISKRYRRIA